MKLENIIIGVNFSLDVKKMPLGRLSKAQIAKGFEVSNINIIAVVISYVMLCQSNMNNWSRMWSECPLDQLIDLCERPSLRDVNFTLDVCEKAFKEIADALELHDYFFYFS